MSLKAFHVVFVIVCVVLLTGFGVYEVVEYGQDGTLANLVMAVLGFVTAAVMAVYGRWFLRKIMRTELS